MKRFAIALVVLATSSPAASSVVVPLTLDQLAARAAMVVHGKVVSQRSRWEQGRIVTETTLGVLGALKGGTSRQVTVQSMGGVVAGIGQMVHGEASFRPGEEVVVFLRAGPRGLRTIGMGQGKFRITKEKTTGKVVARQQLAGLAFARRLSGKPLRIDHPSARQRRALPIQDFFARIAKAVADAQVAK